MTEEAEKPARQNSDMQEAKTERVTKPLDLDRLLPSSDSRAHEALDRAIASRAVLNIPEINQTHTTLSTHLKTMAAISVNSALTDAFKVPAFLKAEGALSKHIRSLDEAFKTTDLMSALNAPSLGLLENSFANHSRVFQDMYHATGLAAALSTPKFHDLDSTFSQHLSSVGHFHRTTTLTAALDTPRFAELEKAYQTISSISELTHSLARIPDMSALLRTQGLSGLGAQASVFDPISRAAESLPDWLRPGSVFQAFQPSWELTAGLGLAGLTRPGLVHDALAAIHNERNKTVGFETAVQLLELADESGTQVADSIVAILRSYVSDLLDLLAQTKDWLRRQGLISVLALIFAAISCYLGWEQVTLGQEQLEFARHSVAPDPSSAQLEILEQLQILNRGIASLEVVGRRDREERVVVRPTPLRKEPNATGAIVRRVYPDDRVRVLEVQRSWARVELYGYNSEAIDNGWLNRSALRQPER